MASIFARQGLKVAKYGPELSFWRRSIISNLICLRHSTSKAISSANPLPQTTSSPVIPDASCYSTRTHTCGELNRKHVGMTVCLKGWIQYDRKKFLILRDAYGLTQILLDDLDEDMQKIVDLLTLESVIEVKGEVVLRPENQIRNNMITGEIEIKAHYINVLGAALPQMPMSLQGTKLPTDKQKLRYRYLYLRFPHMQKILRLRSQLIHTMREFLTKNSFVDVETPTLFKKTPGGAQEFVVPTQNTGLFYSLVQSPQQFKQLLMVGGLDRYFQIARCYRDEDARSDRQPEFTQLDIEMSFVNREGVMLLIEELMKQCWPSLEGRPTFPIPQMTFNDAMTNYGSDKPDTRFDAKICDVTHLLFAHKSSDQLEKQSGTEEFSAKAILFPDAATVCKKDQLDELCKTAINKLNDVQLFMIPVKNMRDLKYSLLKVLQSEEVDKILKEINPKKGDLVLFCLGPNRDALEVLGAARILVANSLEGKGFQIRDTHNHLLWVVDFPLFEKDKNGSLVSAHHPFTQPHPDDRHLLEEEPLKVRGLHYDLVLNGSEIGGGSIRISDAQLQRYILEDILHVDTSSLQHLLDALSLGCPPHGGIALGLDRLIAMLCGVSSIREVIAFPKSVGGRDHMADAPAPLTKEDAKLYNLPFVSK